MVEWAKTSYGTLTPFADKVGSAVYFWHNLGSDGGPQELPYHIEKALSVSVNGQYDNRYLLSYQKFTNLPTGSNSLIARRFWLGNRSRKFWRTDRSSLKKVGLVRVSLQL